MKKLLIPILLIVLMILTACKDEAPIDSQDPTPTPRVIIIDDSDSSPEPIKKSSNKKNKDEDKDEDKEKEVKETEKPKKTEAPTEEPTQKPDKKKPAKTSGTLTIVNDTSIPIVELYLSDSSSGHLGESIIAGSVLESGDETSLSFADTSSMSGVTLVAEDANGVKYTVDNFSLKADTTIELNMNGGSMVAVEK